MLTDEQLFCLEGCRSYKQYHQMRSAFEAGTSEKVSCIFCNLDRTLNEVIWESRLAMAWHVPKQFQRAELRYHGLVVPKRHVRFIAELTEAEVLDVHHAMVCLNKCFGYLGGVMHAREGDMRFNAGTVPHLHYNIFEPNWKGEVRIPVFKDPSDREENRKRAAEYAARYEASEKP